MKTTPPLATMQADKRGVPTLQGALAGATIAPRMQVAEESPVQLPTTAATPTVVPKTAAIPSELTASAAAPTPQTAQTVEQKTQAPPVANTSTSTSASANTEYGYTDDPNEHAPPSVLDRLLSVPRGVHGAIKDIGWAANDITSQAAKGLGDLIGDATAPLVKAATPDPRYTDPRYVESTQGFDEAGMEGVDKYVTPEAVPGEGTRALLGGANSIIQSIQDRAKAYNTLQAGRNESRQLEQVYNYPQPQAPQAASTGSRNIFGQQTPIEMPYNSVTEERPLTPTSQSTEQPTPYDPTELGRQQMQAAEANVQMPPQERESIPSTLSPRADSLSFDPNTEGVPSYAIPPEVQQLMQRAQPTPPTTPPLPVEAAKVADAMFNTNTEGVPSYTGPPIALPTVTIPDMSNVLAGVFPIGRGKQPSIRVEAQPTKAPIAVKKIPTPVVMPSGEVLYPAQPPQVVPPKRAPAKEPYMPTVPGVTDTKGAKTMPSSTVPPRQKYDPNAPKVYDYDPNTKKAIIPKQQQEEPVEQIAPDTDEEEQ